MKLRIKSVALCTVCICLITSCAEFKSSGRAIGHATRDITKAVGHGVRDTTKAIGHGTRRLVKGTNGKNKNKDKE